MLALIVAASISCPSFTDDQRAVLDTAYQVGRDVNGYILPALVWQESFLGDDIIRFSPRDGNLGSYGVAHMQLTTIMHNEGIANTRANRAKYGERLVVDLMTNDLYAINQANNYLTKHIAALGVERGVARYNGSGAAARRYSETVLGKAKTLQQCKLTDWE